MLKITLITIILLLVFGTVQAAEITYQITNDAGTVVASGKVETNDAVLAQVEVWRSGQQSAEDGEGPVPSNTSEVFKRVLVTFIHGVLNRSPTPELKKQLDAFNAIQESIKNLVRDAAH